MGQYSLCTTLRHKAGHSSALSPLGGLRKAADAALRGTLITALVLSPVVANAQQAIITPQAGPDGSSNPGMDMAGNGTPIIKIATPENGTSYNRYGDFNVDQRGLILNNSDKIVTTTLGGYIDGNGNLKRTGPASLIINEVTGNGRSTLGGYIEIAGQKADIILANPYGISCMGCGFLNTAHVTLAAAKPILGGGGSLNGFVTTTGTLDVGGRGLDASGARLDLFARAITLNAGVWADSINASYGAGTAASGAEEIVVTARAAAQSDQPRFGLDVAALGGMYARSIRLIGTEAGLGVNVDGTLAGIEQNVSLSADGDIRIAGVVTAKTSAAINTGGTLDVGGQVYADGPASVYGGAVAGNGLIASGSDLRITAGTMNTNATIAAGLARDGSVSQTGNLTLATTGAMSLGGSAFANNAVILQGGTIALGGTIRSGGITANADSIVISGDVRSTSSASLSGALTNTGILQGQAVTIKGSVLDNSDGIIDAGGSLDVQSAAITNNRGLMQSAGALKIIGDNLANGEGVILALGSGALSLSLAGVMSGANGEIGGNGDVAISAGSVNLGRSKITALGTLNLTSQSGDLVLGTGSTIAASGNVTFSALGIINARGSSIIADSIAKLTGTMILLDDAVLQADQFALFAPAISLKQAKLRQTGTHDFTLSTAGSLDYSGGELYSAGHNFVLSANSIVNAGGAIVHNGTGTMNITATSGIDNQDGLIATNGSLSLFAASLTNTRGKITANGAAALDVTGSLSNTDGLITSGNGLQLTAGDVINASGAIETMGVLDARLASLSGANGTVLATGAGAKLALGATGTLSAPGGLIGSTGDVSIRAASLALGSGSRLTSGGALEVTATTGGIALAGGTADSTNLTLNAAGGVLETGTGGLILASDTLQINAETVNLGGGVVQGGTIKLGAKDFLNNGGTLQSLGALNANLSGTFNNAGGTVFANGNLSVSTADLANIGGRIFHGGAGALDLRVTDLLNNSAAGIIATNGTLDLRTGSIVNDDGQVTAALGASIMSQGALSNLGGILQSDRFLSINAHSMANDAGTIDSLDALDILVSSIANGSGSIVSRGGTGLSIAGQPGQSLSLINGTGIIGSTVTLKVNAGDISNAGSIVGDNNSLVFSMFDNKGSVYGSTLSLKGAALINTSGQIGSGGALALTINTIDNRAGKIVSGAAGLVINSQLLRNDSGTLGGDGDVMLGIANIDNGTGTIAAGRDYVFTADTLNNAANGQIWADRNGTLSLSSTLSNRGSIAAADTLTLAVRALDNGTGSSAGTLAAGKNLVIDFDTGNMGRVVSGSNLNLVFAGDYTNAAGQSLVSLGDITLSTTGNFFNQGRLEGTSGVRVTADGSLTNTATGEIIGQNLALTAGGTLLNQGLINGGVVTLSGNSVTNERQVFGDSVTIKGLNAILNRGSTAVIATRLGLLDLQSNGTVENIDKAFLYSLGDLRIGGNDGIGAAASLNNSSATIQAQNNIILNVNTILNQRTDFVFGTVTHTVVGERESHTDELPQDGAYLYKTTIEEITETALTSDSGAGRIVAGGTIAINTTGTFENRYSTLAAGGNILFNAANLASSETSGSFGNFINTGLTGTRTISGREEGEQWFCANMRGPFCQDYDTRFASQLLETRTETITVAPGIISAGGTVAIDARAIDNLNVNVGNGSLTAYAASAGSAAGGSLVGTGVTGIPIAGIKTLSADTTAIGVSGSPVSVPDPAQFGFALIPLSGQPTGAPGALVLDLGGLFRYAGASANYLVETNPAFTNYGNFLSSDYFIGRLGFDPTRVQRRLGDALYEQQLITNQLVSQAGVGRLGGYSDNEAQYRALMDAGVVYMQKFGLALGAALSAEQMATLTSDIVLLVEVTVQTPNGPVQVLAPRVYLTHVNQRDLTSGGAIINGSDMALRSADALTNAGVMRASVSSNITSSSDILNTGRMDLGERGTVSAANDLINRGGTITGGSVTLSAGRDLRLEPLTTTTNVATAYYNSKKNYGTSTSSLTTNMAGTVQVTGDLTLLAGRTLSVTGSNVAVGGDLLAYGKAGIEIGSAVDSATSSAAGRSGKTRFSTTQSSQTNILSNITVGGDATFVTPATLAIKGAAIDAGGALTTDTGTTNISGVIDTAHVVSDTVKKKSGFLSSKKTTTHSDSTDQNVVSSTLSGNTISLRSSGDTNILGSNVVASNGVSITAVGNVTIDALAATDTSDQSVKVKKSGLSINLGGGGLSVFAGVAKNSNATNTTSVEHTGSLVGTEHGDVTINAGNAATIRGSQVVAGGDVSIAADRIAIEHVIDTVNSKSTAKSSSTGVTLSIGSPILSAVGTAIDMAKVVAGNNANDRTKAVAGLTGALTARNTAYAVEDALAGGTIAQASLSFGISKSKSTTETHNETAIGSLVQGDNISLLARGNLTDPASGTVRVTGSDVFASNNLTILAPGAITFESAKETDTLNSKNSSSGFSVGVTASIGMQGIGYGVDASLSMGKGSASGIDVAHRESNIVAGNVAAITTPDALTIRGAVVSAERIAIDAGSLAIESEQDSSTYKSTQKNFSVSGSVGVAQDAFKQKEGGKASPFGTSINVGATKLSGDYASVIEQSGIVAGAGGFDIKVAGNTDLKGAVIASEATADKNVLTTGTLSASDIDNKEKYAGSTIGIGVSFGPADKDKAGNRTAGATGTDAPGSGPGRISTGVPFVGFASGSQSSTTHSAIAPGTIEIRSGDAASETVAATISRDTEGANAGALVQEFTNTKREEIALGFEVNRILVSQTETFLANMAKESDAKEADARDKEEEARTGFGTDKDGKPILLTTVEIAQRKQDAAELRKEAGQWAPGGEYRRILTALTAAAGGNVTGSVGDLLQAAAANWLQQKGAEAIGRQAHDGDGKLDEGSAEHFLVHTLLGCAGSAAGGGNCAGGAAGAGGSVLLGQLLGKLKDTVDTDGDGKPDAPSNENRNGRSALVQALVAGLGALTGTDGTELASAVTSAQSEAENNQVFEGKTRAEETSLDQYAKRGTFVCDQASPESCLEQYKEAFPKGYEQYIDTFKSEEMAVIGMAGLTKLIELKENNPDDYNALVRLFDGNDAHAALYIGLIDRYESDPSLALGDLLNTFNPFSQAPQGIGDIESFLTGTKDQVVDDASELIGAGKSLFDIVTNPSESLKKAEKFISDVKANPTAYATQFGVTADQVLYELEKYENRLVRNTTLYLLARVTGDELASKAAAYELGKDVGALAIETVTGTIIAKVGVKATTKLGGAINEAYDALKASRTATKAADAAVKAAEADILAVADVCKHHICTDKNMVSTARGGPWTPRFQRFFDGAGLDISKAVENIADVVEHKGPHPQAYHEYVYAELDRAVIGKVPNTPEYREAIVTALSKIKVQAETPGSRVNNWLQTPWGY